MSNEFYNRNPRGNPAFGRESKEALQARTERWRKYNAVWADEARAKQEAEEELGNPLSRLEDARSIDDVLNMMDTYERGGW